MQDKNYISRRNFLNKGAKTTAVATAMSALSYDRVLGANERINMAVIGVRGMGRSHIRQWMAIRGVEVRTLCDIDERLFPERVKSVKEKQGVAPKTEYDMRKVFDDKDIDAVSMATPNHWHALGTVWALKAGKHVFIEKPVSHNISEGRKMIEAAEKYDRIVQVNTQARSNGLIRDAMKYIHEGNLGDVYMVKSVIFRYRESIGRAVETAVPEGVHYDLFRGPAPMIPYQENRFHYNWHWYWDTGNGETGNLGAHYADMSRWALDKHEHPVQAQSMGDVYIHDSDQETPNTQISTLKYADGKSIQIEVRNHYSNKDGDLNLGIIVYGSEGYLELSYQKWETFFGRDNEPGPKMINSERSDYIRQRTSGIVPHFKNFIDCLRSGNKDELNAPLNEGHLSASLAHLSNISCRVGRTVNFNPAKEKIIGDRDASRLLTRKYRRPYTM